MTPKDRLVTVREGADKEYVLGLFHKHRIEKVLVVDKAFKLRGMITVKIQKAQCKRLRVQGRARRAARRRRGRHRRHRH